MHLYAFCRKPNQNAIRKRIIVAINQKHFYRYFIPDGIWCLAFFASAPRQPPLKLFGFLQQLRVINRYTSANL